MSSNASRSSRHLPAEWAPQSGVMLTWPHAGGAWGTMLPAVENVFGRIAAEISTREQVLLVAADAAHARHIRSVVAGLGGEPARVITGITASDDTWARDHGAVTVITPDGPRLLDFSFNGWGGKYGAARDNRISRSLYAQGVFGATPFETVDFVLEGGSFDSDGAGTLLTTSRCLLHPGRNPGLHRIGIATRLREWFGVERVLWLEQGALAGDDTDSHVDTLARFASTDTILYQACGDPHDENFGELTAMAHELADLRQPGGQRYKLVPLPSPRPIRNRHGQRLPASYANFLIINGAVLVPAYSDPADEAARGTIANCFPDREVILIDCVPLIHQFGSLHCVTMQFPAGVLATS